MTKIFGIVLILILPLKAATEWRTFTDKTGRSFEGRVLSVEQGAQEFKVLVRSSSRTATIKFDVLSDADVEYLKGWTPPPDEVEEDSSKLSPKLYPRTKEEIQQRIAEIQKREAPKGIDAEQQKTVNQLNIYRYLCGVSDEVVADPKMVEQATKAAEACKKHGDLSHDIGEFTDICNLSGGESMFASVRGYILDPGSNNREKRGHRRWCLNPPMGRTGFGAADKYSAMVAVDSSGGKRMRDSWAYPGKGFFPIEYLHGNAWSLYLGGGAPSKDDVKVEVYKLESRPEKPFSSTDEIPGVALPVGYVSTYMNSINFEPQPKAITERGIYWVRVHARGLREGYLVELY